MVVARDGLPRSVGAFCVAVRAKTLVPYCRRTMGACRLSTGELARQRSARRPAPSPPSWPYTAPTRTHCTHTRRGSHAIGLVATMHACKRGSKRREQGGKAPIIKCKRKRKNGNAPLPCAHTPLRRSDLPQGACAGSVQGGWPRRALESEKLAWDRRACRRRAQAARRRPEHGPWHSRIRVIAHCATACRARAC